MPGTRFLILDDDAMVGQMLLVAAKTGGHEAQWCAQPQPFFDAVRDWQPTHLAVDLTMPEMSGLEVLRRLAAEGCRAQVIISSGVGTGELDAALNEARSLGLPMLGVLPKPFSLAALRTMLAGPPAG